MSEPSAGLARLREPFLENQIGKKPQPYQKDSPKKNCTECGGYHGMPAMHLDYVGHAAVTDRYLEVDPQWNWEPLAFDADGLPLFDKLGGLWIRLTVCGVTRIGYGDAQGKNGSNAIKEAIGDALRNGGIRFGVALDLWHKGDLHEVQEAAGITQASDPAQDEVLALKQLIVAAGKKINLGINDLRDQYAADNGGLTLADANPEQLQKFLTSLQAQPVPA